MRIYFAGILGSLLYNFGASILRAAGDTKSPLIYLTIAGALNVVLNMIFVRFLRMNVAGVALATVLTQALAAGLVLRELMKRKDACRLIWKKLKIHGPSLAKILRIGLPAGAQGSLFSISNVIIQSSVNSFGSVVVNGNAAAANIEGFAYVAINSFSQAALNFTGQNIGAGKHQRVKKIMGICLGYAAATGLVLGSLLYLFAEPLLSIYINDSAQAILHGTVRMAYVSLFYFICGLMDSATGVLRGLGASLSAMLITVLGVCGLRLLWVYTIFQIPAFHSMEWLLTSYPVSWVITFLAELLVLAVKLRKFRGPEGTKGSL